MPLTLYVVSSILLLGIVAGGVLAYFGISRAVDGYEDEEGFHLRTAGDPRAPSRVTPVQGGSDGAVSLRV